MYKNYIKIEQQNDDENIANETLTLMRTKDI